MLLANTNMTHFNTLLVFKHLAFTKQTFQSNQVIPIYLIIQMAYIC